MNKQTLIKKLKALHDSPSCCPELKHATKSYLDALALERVAAKNFFAELEDDIVDIDSLLTFSHSPQAVEKLGAERAKIFADNADALKAAGAKYCNCLACTIGLEILADKEILLD